ncbi:MAG: hypothetical protein ABJD24_08960 [Acidimicrobiales bacterium]
MTVMQAARLDVLADSLWWLGRLDECIDAESVPTTSTTSWAIVGGRECAVWLYEHHCFKARPSAAGA